MLFALSGTWIAIIVVLGVLALIGLTVYSIFTLRKPENWEQR
jgi:flagellar basal body-associated protein FliL